MGFQVRVGRNQTPEAKQAFPSSFACLSVFDLDDFLEEKACGKAGAKLARSRVRWQHPRTDCPSLDPPSGSS